MSLLAGGTIFCGSASAQLVNGDFSDGLNAWTVDGSNTFLPDNSLGSATFAPGLGAASVSSGTALLTTGPGAVAVTRLSQVFGGVLDRIPGKLGRGTGRLALSGYGGALYSPQIRFTYQALTREVAGAPFDFFKATFNSKQVAFEAFRDSNTNGPGAFGFTRGSAVTEVAADVSSLVGANNNLSFVVADTLDNQVDSAVAISHVRLSYLLEDIDAIQSAQNSALPVALAQRQILLNAAENANRDVNARLFRLRAQGAATGALSPVAEGGKQVKQILPPEQRWDFFATGKYGYRDVDSIGSSAGFNTDLFTATLGLEYKLAPQLSVGMAITGLDSDNDLGDLGSTKVEGYSIAGYASFFAKHFYADLLYSVGSYEQQIRRSTGSGRTATAAPASFTNSVQFNTGYNFNLGRVITGPIISVDWIHGDINGYTEEQGGGANVVVTDQNVDSLISRLGWQVSMPLHARCGTVTPQLRAVWVHEYLNDSQPVGVSLANSPFYFVDGSDISRVGSFKTSARSQAPGNDYLSAGGGVEMQIGERTSIVLDYEASIYQNNSVAQNVSLTGSIKF